MKHGHRVFTESELLCFLLSFATPHKDNVDLSRSLIDKFGSFTRVIEADYGTLLTVHGIDSHTALSLSMFRKLSQAYYEKKTESNLSESFTPERMENYCKSLFMDANDEELYCIFLTDNLKLITSEKMCTGSAVCVNLSVRRVVQSVFANNCNRLVIAHNHPAGSCLPSTKDVNTTNDLRSLLAKIEIDLIDHIVVGNDGVISMKKRGFIKSKTQFDDNF